MASGSDRDAQPVVGERALSRYAHRFFLIWGILSILMLVIAALLTAMLVRVPRLAPVYHPIGMYGRYSKDTAGWIYYYDTSLEGHTFLVYYPAGTTLLALPPGRLAGCVMENTRQIRVPSSDISTSHYQDHAYTVVRISHAKSGAAADGKVSCEIDFKPNRTSFTRYGMDFWFLPSRVFGDAPVKYLNFSATIDGADNIEVSGAKSTSASGVVMEPDDESVIDYSDVRGEGLRDVVLVVIGALIALGAAMLLEAIRPYIELAAAVRRRL